MDILAQVRYHQTIDPVQSSLTKNQCPNRLHLDNTTIFRMAVNRKHHKHSRLPKVQANGLFGGNSKWDGINLFRFLPSTGWNQAICLGQPTHHRLTHPFCVLCGILLCMGILHQPRKNIDLDPSPTSRQNHLP
jgi:hypothetical protein